MTDQRKRVRLLGLLAGIVCLAGAGLSAQVTASMNDAWGRYVATVEQRRAREQGQSGGRFLALDFEASSANDRRAMLNGTVVMRHLTAVDGAGHELEVPDAMVHHWRGAVFLPGLTVQALIAQLEVGPPPQEDVLRSAVLSRGPDQLRVFLRLQRRKIVTVVYNTEHDVRFIRLGPGRAASTSVATKIAEVRNPGLSSESEYAPGDDHGYLWKLNAYWRYEDVPGGVIAECESVSLSRSVPFLVRTLVNPLIDGAARESLERTLTSLRVRP